MKTKTITYLLVLLFFSSCHEVKRPEKPTRLLSETEMVNILVDMAIVSSAKGVNKKAFEKNGIVPDQFIYEKNNIDSLVFAESNNYYAFDIKKYESIYTRVKDSLTQLRDAYKLIENKEKEVKRKEDSIKRASKKALKSKKLKKKQSLK